MENPEPFSNFAVNFNLRRYDADPAKPERVVVRFADVSEQARRCRLYR